jgi:PAS domain S-box-containing protein
MGYNRTVKLWQQGWRPVAGEPKEKSAGEEGTVREAVERGSFARERERLLERERAARAEAERARQETRAILESISDGFFTLDREQRFVYVNREAERFWGKPREELVGKNVREVFPWAAGSEGYRAIERAAKEGVTTEFEMASSVVPGAWVAGRIYPSAEGLSVYFQDITVGKRAEEELRESQEALRKSEEFHRFAVEAGRIGTWDLDLQTEECLISPRMADLMGYSPDQKNVPGAQWWESIVPDDRTLMASALAASIESDAPFDLEFRIALKDGTQRWLYSRGGVTRDASGKAMRVHGASIDVTERKRTEEKLRESEERLRRAIGIETVGVIFFKADGSITDSNDAFLQMSGYNREDLEQGKVRWDVMTPPEWMPHSLKAIEEFESTGRTKPYEKEYVRKDGSRWWALFAATRLDDEEGVEFIIDITEGKRAEEALRESEERFRTLMEQSPLAIHVFAPDGTSLRYNEAWKELWNLEERSAAPNIFDEERVRAAGLMPYLEEGAAGYEQVTDPLLYDPALTGGRGEQRWLRAFVYPVREGSGRVFEVALMLEDVTERERAQEEHERLLAQEWKARAQAEERRRISRELHDRVAHAMGVAHQSLELHEALKQSDPEMARAKMSLAKEATIEAMNLTRNLAQELRGTEVHSSLSAALSGLLEAAVPPGLERAVSVEGDEALAPPHVREQLFVILREGVRNAVSHSEAGRIDVGVRVSSEDIVGYVEDDGRGYAEEEGAARGGVRSMRERAKLVGGTFRSASSAGVGTSIRVTIPLERGPDNGT